MIKHTFNDEETEYSCNAKAHIDNEEVHCDV